MSAPTTTSVMSSIKLKKKQIRVKHQKVKLFRANEPILSVFMWGINHTVSHFSIAFNAISIILWTILKLQIKELVHINIPVMLMPNDFKAYSKIKVDNHLFNK